MSDKNKVSGWFSFFKQIKYKIFTKEAGKSLDVSRPDVDSDNQEKKKDITSEVHLDAPPRRVDKPGK